MKRKLDARRKLTFGGVRALADGRRKQQSPAVGVVNGGLWPLSVGDRCQLSGCSLECQVYGGKPRLRRGPKRNLVRTI